jgi:uncharacterized membrane protein HdeD (DUF308 family)
LHGHGSFSIWFFIGLLLTSYGVLIMGAGIYYYDTPFLNVQLSNLHAPVWWGAFLLLVGLFYLIRFFPKKR